MSVNLKALGDGIQFHALQGAFGSFHTRTPRDSRAILQEVH